MPNTGEPKQDVPKTVLAMSVKTKKTTEIIPQAQLDELRFLSGEGKSFQPSMQLPTIGVNHKRKVAADDGFDMAPGIFTITENIQGKKVVSSLGEEFTAVILRVRKRLSVYISEQEHFQSPEYDSPNDIIPIMDAKGMKILQNRAQLIPSLKLFGPNEDQYLKVSNVLYISMEEKIYRFYIRGASGKEFRSFLRRRGKEPLPTVYVKFTLSKEQKGSNVYYIVHEQIEESVKDLAPILEQARTLNAFIEGTRSMREEFTPGEVKQIGEVVADDPFDEVSEKPAPDFLQPDGVGVTPNYNGQKSADDLKKVPQQSQVPGIGRKGTGRKHVA